MGRVRWAFNVSKWHPSVAEMTQAIACVQPEEKERLGRFVFKNDLKASLIGRLLMRKFVSEFGGLKYNEIRFLRDEKGKPYIPNLPNVHFNVSHQGDYAVLAGELNSLPNFKLGVDVMKLEYSGGKSLSEFFRVMTRQFSTHEWATIKSCGSYSNQVGMFCRHWCLKESYVKAIGVGITVNLQEISFKVNSPHLGNKPVCDTQLYVGDCLQEGWVFEEMLLGSQHCVAVALNATQFDCEPFRELLFNELMANAVEFNAHDPQFTDSYFLKMDKS